MMFKRWLIISKYEDCIYSDYYCFTNFGANRKYSDLLNVANITAIYMYHYENGDWAYVRGWCAE